MKKSLIWIMLLVAVAIFANDVTKETTNRDVPQTINFQAAVKDANGMPVNDNRIIEFRIYDSLTGGTQMWSEIHYNVEITDGIFSVELGNSTAFASNLFETSPLYITFVMGGEEMSPRQKLNAVPYAINAKKASSADYAGFAEETMSISGLTATDLVTQDNNGDVNIMGTMTANAFVGDGSALTGLSNIYVNKTGPDSMSASYSGGVLNITNTFNNGSGVKVVEAGDGIFVESVRYDGLDIDETGDRGVEIGTTGNDGVYVYSAGTPSSQNISDTKNGFEVAGAEGNGLYVGQADSDGIVVESVGTPSSSGVNMLNNGLEIRGTEGNGVAIARSDVCGFIVESAGEKGLFVYTAGSPSGLQTSVYHNGVEIAGAEGNGLYVGQADENGVKVYSAGSPSSHYMSSEKNGFVVAGAEGNGLYVGQADEDGIFVKSAEVNGIYVHTVGSPSAIHSSIFHHNGVEIAGTQGNGIFVGQADKTGVLVKYAAQDGFFVNTVGSPSTQNISNANNGFEVGGAEGNGLYVGQADLSGVYVGVATNHAIDVLSNNNGVSAYTNNINHEWGVYTNDKIYGSNITTRSLSTHVINTGSESLEAGDIVCIANGFAQNILGENEVIPNVEKANSRNSNAVFGVVEYKVSVIEEDDKRNKGKTLKSFKHADGKINKGDYLSVIVFGPADVKTDGRSNIKAGEKLTTADNGKTRSINKADNWTIGILGKALENSNGKNTVKVFVNCK